MMQPFTIVKYIPATVNDCKIRTRRKRQLTSTAIVKLAATDMKWLAPVSDGAELVFSLNGPNI